MTAVIHLSLFTCFNVLLLCIFETSVAMILLPGETITLYIIAGLSGAKLLSGRVLDSRPRGRGFEPHRRHCVVSLSKNINPSLVLVQHRKTRPLITEILLMGRK